MSPTYSYPCATAAGCQDEGRSFYTKVGQAAQRGIPTIAIVNPQNGDFTAQNSDYVTALSGLASAGVQERVGYVYTLQGARSRADVEARIRAWAQIYQGRVTGIFFDQVSPRVSDVALYNGFCEYATQQGLPFSILNLGRIPEPGWSTTCDVVVAFESGYNGTPGEPGTSWLEHTLPSWLRAYGPSRLAALVHTATESEMVSMVSRAAAQGYGYVYATDDIMPNPYNFSPTYWEAELNRVSGTAVGSEALPEDAVGLNLSVPQPNPSAGRLSFTVTLDSASDIQLVVVDALGRRVAVLHDGPAPAGLMTLTVDPEVLAPGVYSLTAQTPHGSRSVRFSVVR